MRLFTNCSPATVLLCLMSVISVCSYPNCIRCICEVTNSPNCMSEGCGREVTATDHQGNSNGTVGYNANLFGGYLGGRITTPRSPLSDIQSRAENIINQLAVIAKPTHNRPKRSCGPFKLDIRHYIACGRPGIQHGEGDTIAFQRCATSSNCAGSCVQNYTKMYANKCPGQSSCEIWSRTHFGHFIGLSDGAACKSPKTLPMWTSMANCLKGIATPAKPNNVNSNSKTNLRAKSTTPKPSTNAPVVNNINNILKIPPIISGIAIG